MRRFAAISDPQLAQDGADEILRACFQTMDGGHVSLRGWDFLRGRALPQFAWDLAPGGGARGV